jgi:uncharacterized membrane protein
MLIDPAPKKPTNFFVRIHPAQRILISLGLSAIVFAFTQRIEHNPLTKIMLVWDVFALTFIISDWVVLLKRSPSQIRQFASKEDGSLIYIFVLIVLASFASMFTVLLLILSKDLSRFAELRYIITAVGGMVLSWILVHTIFCFHYAHMYYDNDENDKKRYAGGLEFPSDTVPDYLDFAYFSFVIGMTWQVSDVQITSKRIRRIVLMHALLSFVYNTVILALSINIISGLIQR